MHEINEKGKLPLIIGSVSPIESCLLNEQVEFQGMNNVQIYRVACEPVIEEYTDGKAQSRSFKS